MGLDYLPFMICQSKKASTLSLRLYYLFDNPFVEMGKVRQTAPTTSLTRQRAQPRSRPTQHRAVPQEEPTTLAEDVIVISD